MIVFAILTVVSVSAASTKAFWNIARGIHRPSYGARQKGMTKRSRHRRKTKNRSSLRMPSLQTTEMKQAGSWTGDLRELPSTQPQKQERPQRPAPKVAPKIYKKPLDQNR
jgi:hypothetical protein